MVERLALARCSLRQGYGAAGAQVRQSAADISFSTLEDDQKEPKMESIMRQQCVRRGDNVERRAAYVKGTRPTRTPFKLAQSPLRG